MCSFLPATRVEKKESLSFAKTAVHTRRLLEVLELQKPPTKLEKNILERIFQRCV